jgi:branched-chain amino acid transport system ATP-binding protein
VGSIQSATLKSLEARGVSVSFDGLQALGGVDLDLNFGEILGLIGPNGAGKTTLVNVLSGFVRPLTGTVVLEGASVTAASPQRLARMGLVRTFQNVRVFRQLTVMENVELGGVGVGLGRREARQRAQELLEVNLLSHLVNSRAGALSYGDEKRIGLLRALAAHPRYLLLDEPAAGLDELESDELASAIKRIRGEYGCGILLIEHDMRLVMNLCDRVQVLDYGKSLATGSPLEIRNDPAVIRAYLGDLEGRPRANG